ncbi:MAG: hypothetical protein QM776_17400 [Rhodocyclaceae bacterium]
MPSRRSADPVTRRLGSARYVLTIPRHRQPIWWWLGALLLLGAAGVAMAMRAGTPEAQVLEERDQLRLEVGNLQQAQRLSEMKLQQEVATREELVKQVDTLTQKLKQTEQELSFFKNHQRVRGTPTAPGGAAPESASQTLAPAVR